jgi:hypothetical protein
VALAGGAAAATPVGSSPPVPLLMPCAGLLAVCPWDMHEGYV